MRWSPFPRIPSPGSPVGHRRSVLSLAGADEAVSGVWTGPAAPWPPARQEAAPPHPPPSPPRSANWAQVPEALQQALPQSRSEALRGRRGRSLSSSLPLQVLLFFPSAGTANLQHPRAPPPPPWGQSQQLFTDTSTAPVAAEILIAASLVVVLPF